MLKLEMINMKTYFQLRTRDTIRRNGRLRLDRGNAVSQREVSYLRYSTPNERRLTCYICSPIGKLVSNQPNRVRFFAVEETDCTRDFTGEEREVPTPVQAEAVCNGVTPRSAVSPLLLGASVGMSVVACWLS